MNTQVSYCKKVLVVLMAVMMVFTMMPSMAWAEDNAETYAEKEYLPKITKQPSPEKENNEYDELSGVFLDVEAEATGGGELSYHWYRVSTPGDEKLSDDYAMGSMCLAPANILGTSQYYCLVINTVNGKEYSVKSDVATVTIYKPYIKTLSVAANGQTISSNSGQYPGATFNLNIYDRDDYKLNLQAKSSETDNYSMTVSYNGEVGEKQAYNSTLSLDTTKIPYGSTGNLKVEVGEYDTAENKYSASEIYIFNFTKIPGLKSFSVSEKGRPLPTDTDLCAVSNKMYTQTKTTQAAETEVMVSATPLQNTTAVYIGGDSLNTAEKKINPNEYPVVYEGQVPYAVVPVKLVAGSVEQTYNAMIRLAAPYIQINTQPLDVTCYSGDVATLNVVAAASDNETLTYQWYRVGTDKDERVADANAQSYTPPTNTVGETSYYCLITSTKDEKTYTTKSEIATVTVKDEKNFVPVILSQPESRINCNQGDEITLSVEVLQPKQGNLTYQWYQNGIKPIPVAPTKDYKPSTEFNGTKSYYCVITNTVDENTYTATSKTVMVCTALTQNIHAATVTNQPGTYIFDKKQGIVEGAYKPVSKGNSKPAPFYVRFTHADYDIEASLSLYHATTNSYDNAELVDNAIISGNGQGYDETGDYKDYKIDPNTAYPTGEHYFYVVITLSPKDKNPEVAPVSTKSDILKIDFVERTTNLEGKGTQEDPYLIKTAADLTGIQQLAAGGDSFAGAYFKIVNDITLPTNWSPIGTKDCAFSGSIDGKKNDNTNATITVPTGGMPLLGYIKDAYVKNLNIYGEQIEGAGLVNNYTGVGLDGNAITIENVCLKSGSKTLKSGLVASSDGNGFAHASAGFVVTIRNCTIEENVVVGYKGNESQIGSIAGRINGTIESCTSAATVKGASYVGGILGTRDNAMSQCVVKNCTFSGSVEASGNYAGGIVGGGYDNQTAPNGASPTIIACSVTGSVTGNEAVGGIFGGDGYVAQTWDNVVGSISANRFSGKVSGNKYVGAIIGYRNSLNRYDTIKNNFYTKDCGTENAIGFVKYLDTSYKNPTKPEGTIVFSTENGTKDCPTVEGCAWKAKHNRTDDPLGKDMENLAKMVDSLPNEAICYELVLKEGKVKTDYYLGEDFSFGNAKFTAKWTDGTEKEVAAKDITVSGYNKNSHSIQTVTLTYGYGQMSIQVAVKQKESSDDKKNILTVSFTLLGDSVHGEADQKGGPHGLAMGGLSTWMSGSYEVKINSTVWDLMQQIQNASNSKVKFLARDSQYGTYVEGVTYDRTTLREFDNGNLSGWMYTLNGKHPEVGVAAQFLSDRDTVVFHYTDDYTKEEGSEKWNTPGGAEEEVKDVTTAGASGSATTKAPTVVKVSQKTNADGTKETVADVKVAAEHQDEIIKQAAEKKSAEIILEVSAANTKGADSVQMELDVKFVKNVADKTNADLTVNTENGKVTLDQETIKTVLAEAKGATIMLEVTKVAKPTEAQKKAAGANGHLLKLTIKSGDRVISDFNKGKVKVVAEIVSKLLNKKVAAIHIADDGKIEQLAGKVLTIGGKKYYEFTTPHFSTFALVDADELGLDVAEEPQTDVKALTAKLTPVARSAKTAKKNVKVTVSLDKQDKAIIKELKDAGYTVKYRFYRSTKKAAGYKAAVTKKTASYINTGGKKGTKYFYKVQVRAYDENGKLVAKTALKQCKYATRTWSK